MVESVVIICDDAPFGKNSVVESIRMAAGILAVGDVEDVKVIILEEAVYFFDKNLNPEALNVADFKNVIRLIELADLEIFIHDEALENSGLTFDDLNLKENLKIKNLQEISELILNAEMSFKY